MRQQIIFILLLCGGAVISLTACTKVPEWSKPAVIYGKNYKKAADELPQADDYVPVSKVPERPATPDLSHVFEELADKPEGKPADEIEDKPTKIDSEQEQNNL